MASADPSAALPSPKGSYPMKQNATHKYVNNGYYNITLKINDNYGATDKISRKLNVLNVLYDVSIKKVNKIA